MHLKTIISGKEKYRRSADEQKSKKRAKRRNENGLTKKQQELESLKKEIICLKDKVLNNTEISKKLKIDRTKVIRLLKNKGVFIFCPLGIGGLSPCFSCRVGGTALSR